ncbi:MAG: TOBE domain-containing protein, partial [Devosia sp.]|nr:TOBE domain-containing protein [Devosia sp.]
AFVAGFIGVTNFVSGKVTATSGEAVTFDVGGREIAGAWAAKGAGPAVGAAVTGALRAEQVRLAASEAELSDCQTVGRGTVRDAIFEGERLVYEIDFTPGTLLRVFDHDPAAHKQFAIGDNVAMGWNARDVLTFPN